VGGEPVSQGLSGWLGGVVGWAGGSVDEMFLLVTSHPRNELQHSHEHNFKWDRGLWGGGEVGGWVAVGVRQVVGT
jgi:hypothetical protein